MTKDEAMRLALDALNYAADEIWCENDDDIIADARTALRTALAQHDVPETDFGETEPVAWWDGIGRFATVKEKDWDRRTGGILSAGRDIPLYTAPPQREWQGLTKEEAREICVANVPYVADMVTALEAKLKEKNT